MEAIALLILWAEMVNRLLTFLGYMTALALILGIYCWSRSTKLVPVQTDESEPYEAPEK